MNLPEIGFGGWAYVRKIQLYTTEGEIVPITASQLSETTFITKYIPLHACIPNCVSPAPEGALMMWYTTCPNTCHTDESVISHVTRTHCNMLMWYVTCLNTCHTNESVRSHVSTSHLRRACLMNHSTVELVMSPTHPTRAHQPSQVTSSLPARRKAEGAVQF